MLDGRRRATPTPHGGPLRTRKQTGPLGHSSPTSLPRVSTPDRAPCFQTPKYRGLLDTLRMCLDHAGDARRAAFTLHVHRST
ncbi:helix-turn-helix domain-containing protein [Streptomyces niveus]|uniref:helix-turn-helix domain-containing protein n=1 Tax=Streptomyces niveus TaxID=193462 RepID=UPI00344C3BEB